jgi:hypothetical protein
LSILERTAPLDQVDN